MSLIIQSIVDFFSFILASPWKLAVELLEWIVSFVKETIPEVVWALLPSGLADTLKDINIVGLSELIDVVTWFIPFWEIMGIWAAAYSLAGAVRLVRFIIGWLPTVEG